MDKIEKIQKKFNRIYLLSFLILSILSFIAMSILHSILKDSNIYFIMMIVTISFTLVFVLVALVRGVLALLKLSLSMSIDEKKDPRWFLRLSNGTLTLLEYPVIYLFMLSVVNSIKNDLKFFDITNLTIAATFLNLYILLKDIYIKSFNKRNRIKATNLWNIISHRGQAEQDMHDAYIKRADEIEELVKETYKKGGLSAQDFLFLKQFESLIRKRGEQEKIITCRPDDSTITKINDIQEECDQLVTYLSRKANFYRFLSIEETTSFLERQLNFLNYELYPELFDSQKKDDLTEIKDLIQHTRKELLTQKYIIKLNINDEEKKYLQCNLLSKDSYVFLALDNKLNKFKLIFSQQKDAVYSRKIENNLNLNLTTSTEVEDILGQNLILDYKDDSFLLRNNNIVLYGSVSITENSK